MGRRRGPSAGYSRIGDDVAATPAKKGKLVVKVDMLVEGTDVPRGMSYREAARKAVAACVSDFASKGARPDSFLVSLGIRKGTTQRQVEELSAGLRDAEKEWKVTLVGGDTNEAKELVVDCAMFGFANRIVARSGARVGDALVVSGEFGLPPAGLKILTAGAKAERRFREKAVRSVLHPSPNLEAGVALGGYLSSGMDSSDGFAKSIHALARESGVGFEVRELPAGFGVKKFAKDNGLDWEKLVLAGGEEYVIVGTVRKSRVAAAGRAAERSGGKLIVIGKATAARDGVVLRSSRGRRKIADEGWTHLG